MEPEEPMNRLEGRVVVVTGGAKGIGRACCAKSAEEGAKVVVADINVKEGRKTLEGVFAAGGQGFFIRHDVRSDKNWKAVIYKLDALVNSAGIATLKRFRRDVEHTDLKEWRAIMAVNMEGVFRGTKYAINCMKKRGSIINICSTSGIVGDYDLAAYTASKGGVRLFTKSAALHYGRMVYNIRINSVHPAAVDTDLLRSYFKTQPDPAYARKLSVSDHPLHRIGTPEETANGVVFLASDESSFMTGSELVIDGGLTAK
jgi:NAD(P)-dependent dehydrogenase (short-subunit alcohol dehydrogenase family)